MVMSISHKETSKKEEARLAYLLHLADNALILGHRNSEWTGRGPVLEQDIAISNIALDLIGQARNFFQYAAKLIGDKKEKIEGVAPETTTEDSLAYLRDGWDFKNCLLVEQENGDWAKTILRQFFFSVYQFYLYEDLQYSTDSTIGAICEKALKEVTYHLRWSSEWVIRMGDGTKESHERMLRALDELWKFTGELTSSAEYELSLVPKGIAVDVGTLQEKWMEKVKDIFYEAKLPSPVNGIENSRMNWMQKGGKQGQHSEYLGYILAEMQFLQRAYPGCEW
jgi:ring-1,2-phenylacetyl-CoA epoxidase subunit PaaC